MSCNAWNDQWVAKLYDELDPAEERRLAEHLASCEACRRTLDELGRSRLLLREGMAAVPAAPRAVVLRSGGLARSAWAFAAGLAAAVLVFGVGAWAGVAVLGDTGRAGVESEARSIAEANQRRALEQRIATLETQLARVSDTAEAATEAAPAVAPAECVTREELAQGLSGVEERVKYERLGDFEYLLGEMKAIEHRAAGWVDETREAVRLVALTNDPRFSER